MKKYIGLDAHSKSCTFVIINEFGKEIKTQEVPTKEPELKYFIDSITGEKELTFEESTLSRWLFGIIEPLVDKLVICNPLFINKKRGPKNDYTDAYHLAQQLRGDFLTPVHRDHNELLELRILVSGHADLVRAISKLKNQYAALIRSDLLGSPRDKRGRQFYQSAEIYEKLSTRSGLFVGERSFNRINYLEQLKEEYLAEFRNLARRYKEIDALMTIPGIGITRAVYIVAQVGSPSRFKNKHHYWSYCGLVSHEKISGGKSYGKIKSHGVRSLKSVYLGAVQTVLMEKNPLAQIYEDALSKSGDKRLARRALARKLASITLSLMKTGSKYKRELLSL